MRHLCTKQLNNKQELRHEEKSSCRLAVAADACLSEDVLSAAAECGW